MRKLYCFKHFSARVAAESPDKSERPVRAATLPNQGASLVRLRPEFKALGIIQILRICAFKHKKIKRLLYNVSPALLSVPRKCWHCTGFGAMLPALLGRSKNERCSFSPR